MDVWMYFTDPKLGNFTVAVLKCLKKIYTVITVVK